MKQPKTKMVRVAAQSLRIHPTAQRDLIPAKLKEFTDGFDLDAIGVLHAVEYEVGGERALWIIDGQHRVHILMQLGFGEWLVDVKIHLDVTDDAGASALFLKLNNRGVVPPFAKFKNELQAGLPVAVGVARILRSHGLKIAQTGTDGGACCVSALKSLFNRDETGKVLSRSLDIALAAWGSTASAVEGKLLEGLGLICATYNGELDQPALIKKLAKYPGGASGLIGDAKGIREFRKSSLSRCVAERIIETYNLGRRGGRLDPL